MLRELYQLGLCSAEQKKDRGEGGSGVEVWGRSAKRAPREDGGAVREEAQVGLA